MQTGRGKSPVSSKSIRIEKRREKMGTSVYYEMEIKTTGFSWEFFDNNRRIERLIPNYNNYRSLFKQGKTATDARIIKIETTRTQVEVGK